MAATLTSRTEQHIVPCSCSKCSTTELQCDSNFTTRHVFCWCSLLSRYRSFGFGKYVLLTAFATSRLLSGITRDLSRLLGLFWYRSKVKQNFEKVKVHCTATVTTATAATRATQKLSFLVWTYKIVASKHQAHSILFTVNHHEDSWPWFNIERLMQALSY